MYADESRYGYWYGSANSYALQILLGAQLTGEMRITATNVCNRRQFISCTQAPNGVDLHAHRLPPGVRVNDARHIHPCAQDFLGSPHQFLRPLLGEVARDRLARSALIDD